VNPKEKLLDKDMIESESINKSDNSESSEKPATREEVDVLRRMDMHSLEKLRLPELRDLARRYKVSG